MDGAAGQTGDATMNARYYVKGMIHKSCSVCGEVEGQWTGVFFTHVWEDQSYHYCSEDCESDWKEVEA